MHRHQRHAHHREYLHYITLGVLLATAFSAFIKLGGSPDRQFLVVVVLSITYFTWGIFHHMLADDLNWKVVVEYSALAILGVVIVWALLFPFI